MRPRNAIALVFALFAAIAFASPAMAANGPLDPPAGARFDTNDVADFTVAHGPEDPPWAIVFAPEDGSGNNIILSSDDTSGESNSVEVSMGFLALKLDALGTYSRLAGRLRDRAS